MLKCIDMPHNTNSSIKRQLSKLLTFYLLCSLPCSQESTKTLAYCKSPSIMPTTPTLRRLTPSTGLRTAFPSLKGLPSKTAGGAGLKVADKHN